MAHPFNTLNNENGVWKAPIFSPLLSATVELIVEAEKQPLAWQKSIFDELTDNNSALKNDLYQAISAYCHATYSDYHDSTSSHSNCHSSNNAQGLTPHTILICDMAPEKKKSACCSTVHGNQNTACMLLSKTEKSQTLAFNVLPFKGIP
ncbi:hypothetical protein JCM19237_5515 [Photobacterium aphoticum]|uniref:DUF6985 domain-containing protein n=1 Tax=Photobacterium aphoticum TaxID=754436 RepID=A0A090R4P8_9GAMM|nr:hypothetical protein JCM19237_5515 [Photobacterium aphoticum]